MRPLLFHLDIAGGAPHEFETTNFYAVIITGKGLQLILTRNYPDNNDILIDLHEHSISVDFF